MATTSIDYKQFFDFTGGINFRADQFQLLDNESPGMLNVEIDPRGGVFSRAGYQQKHNTEVVTAGGVWNPKGLFSYKYPGQATIMLTTGRDADAAVDGKIYYSTGGNFTKLTKDAFNDQAVPSTDGAGMTQWESTMYFSLGITSNTMCKWAVGDTYTTQLTASGPSWQPYDIPVASGGYMPRANLIKAHANKMFVANTYEDGVAYPNRVRWSHENLPENWYEQDYIDIIAGGSGVTGLRVVDGQLLIFKPKAVYLLMGYDADTFQIVELSTDIGIDYPQQATEGSGGVYFFDYPNGLYFYNRNGLQNVFERIKPIITNGNIKSQYTKTITLTFLRDRLWISMPYAGSILGVGTSSVVTDLATVNFIFDPTIGQVGAYTMFQSAPWYTDADNTQINGYGLVSGCEWQSNADDAFYLMASAYNEFPFVMYVDDYNNTLDDSPDTFSGKFASKYRTAWFDDNRYIQLKTFLNPTFVLKEVGVNTVLTMDVYKNYDETTGDGGTRSISLEPTIAGSTYSTDGSGGVYGTAVYGVDTVGSSIKRKGIGTLGKGFAVQLELAGPDDNTNSAIAPGRPWGLNSIAYRFKRRAIRGN